MEKRVVIDTWQKVTREDFNKFGLFPQESFDTVVGKVLIPDRAFDGFQVTQTGTAEVTAANGHLFAEGKVYVNDTEGGTELDLLSRLPATTKRIVAVVVSGQEIDSKLEPRTFLTDAETRATVARETATEHWRWANIALVSGTEGPDPQRPALDANVVAVAFVTLSTLGVESVARADDNLVPTLRGAWSKLAEIEIWRRIIGTRLDTITSDLLALAERILGAATFEFTKRLAGDIARIKDELRLPDEYVAWAADHFLDESESDPAHPDWLAKIEEGIRFPPAAGFDAQLGLLNPLDDRVIQQNNVLLPAWDRAVRVANVGRDNELAIAQYSFQTSNLTQKSMSRTRLRYGTVFTYCTNNLFWQTGEYDPVTQTFKRGGETFQVLDVPDYAKTVNGWQRFGGLHHVRVQQVWQDTYEEHYWEHVVTTSSVGGAVLSESFPVTQDGWLNRVNLFLSRVAGTGDMRVLITETSNGAPDLNRVLANVNVPVASLKVCPPQGTVVPTPVDIPPTFLRKGRYAIVLITAGNHFVWVLENTNLVAGTLFYSTDGNWFQGDINTDLAFELEFCKFRSNRAEVQLNALQLAGGIAAIDINADSIVPEGTQMFFQVQKDGIWRTLDNVDGGPSVILNGLPPLLPFRVVFVGTDQIAPALGVAANSRVTTWRPRSDFRHISEIRNVLGTYNKVFVDVRVEAWRGAPFHAFTAKLLHGVGYATVLNPAVAADEAAPDDPLNARIFHYTFEVPAITSYRFRFEGTTDNVLTTYHVAERLDIAAQVLP